MAIEIWERALAVKAAKAELAEHAACAQEDVNSEEDKEEEELPTITDGADGNANLDDDDDVLLGVSAMLPKVCRSFSFLSLLTHALHRC